MKRLLALFAVLVVGRVDAEDFLYVLATPVGGASEIHWVPANAPLGARVLVEDLPRSNLLYLHRDSLWWREGGDLVERDLIGQKPGVNGRVDTRGFVRAVVRHGDQLYWSEGGRFWRKGLQDDQRKVSINNVGGIPRVVIHEDRLYFVRSLKPVSVRLDGTDYRVEDGGVGFPSIRRLDPIVMAVQGDRLILGQEKLVWQIDLKTREVMVLDTGLPEIVESIATSNGGVVYWIGGGKVWRWQGVPGEHESIYALGDTGLDALCVVSATPHPLTIDGAKRIHVAGSPDDLYQLLISEDLQFWSPDFVKQSLFTHQGTLAYMDPFTVSSELPFVWQPKGTANEAYFRALRYQLEPPFDSDDDGLPDYWERRHFGGLSPGPAEDTDGDGLNHLGEVAALTNPKMVDTDSDSLTDFEEIAPEIGSNPSLSDTDGDGLDDGVEVRTYGTNPTKRDSDSDSYDDVFEIEFASDPNDRDDIPDLDNSLAPYAEDLMVHFEFDSIDGGLVRNHGQLGGSGRVVGDGAYLLGEGESKSSSGALEIRMDPNDASNVTHIVTDYRPGDLGMAGEEDEFTVSLWIRSIERHWATVFSFAGQEEGSSEKLGLSFKPRGAFISGSSLRVERLGQELSVFNYDLDKRWTHVAWTVSGGEWAIFIGGIVVARRSQVVGGTMSDDGTLTVGALVGQDGPTEPFFGNMDDFRVYRKALPELVVRRLSRRK